MTTKRIIWGLFSALLLVLGTSTAASADYEVPTIDLTVSPTVLIGGEPVSGTATSNQDCAWTVTYSGSTFSTNPATGSGTSIDFTYVTDVVDSTTSETITAICEYDDGMVLRASATQSLSRSADITLLPTGDTLPPGDGDGGGGPGGFTLPNTGGPQLWLLLAGITLLIGGSGAVARSRRAHS